MGFFQKRPVQIEARKVPNLLDSKDIQAYLDESIKLAAWCGGVSYMMTEDDERAFEGCQHVGPHILINDPINEGAHAAFPGDWIVHGVGGEFYGCKPNIFVETYEPALTMDLKVELAEGMHPNSVQLLETFEYDHLPEHLQEISKQFHNLAWSMAQVTTSRGAERTTCLRKLREAKDCAVIMGVPTGKLTKPTTP